ncbi:hypothetical protein JHL22_04940 [Advenella sp. WQ 585]|uniref:F5/8 type C domain-containing protein n=1 Tax=Advenella mandrilli TaxID=2800330 RepID=A0ABS1E9T4_9BURK|nr:discoidin domain-containing protein [Advenella mandrilli]MBK1780556.1 hypothetical protein [Advenella mandrilli]
MIYFDSHITDKRPKIGWQNLSESASASTSVPGFPASAVLNPMTYERWMPAVAPANIDIDLGSIQSVGYVGIAAHTLIGAAVVISHSDDGTTWSEVTAIIPVDNSPIMYVFEAISARYWRFGIGKVAEIGVIYIGNILTMQRKLYGGHSPGLLARQTDILPNISQTGQFLGRSISRKGYATTYQFRNLEAQWVRDELDPFVESALSRPFFIAWKPERFPKEVLYGWCNSDITPVNQGQRDLMSVSFQIEAIA